jgi:D-3-phosphoglycerate dehydrogenase
MSAWKVVVTARSFAETAVGWEALEGMGASVVRAVPVPGTSSPDLASLLADADAAIVGTERVDAAALAPASRLKIVVKAGAGVDNIDLEAAKTAGVTIGSVPGANAGAVADYAVALMLAAGRRLCEVDRSVRRGEWSRFLGVDLFGATVGVAGLGNVGRAVCERLRGFSPTLLGTDVVVDEGWARQADVKITSMDEIVERSDFISLHLPLTDETRGLIGHDAIARLKPSAVIVNTARGGLIDADALYDALVEHRIAAAALDVFPSEPLHDDRFRELENVVLSSHNASYSNDGIDRTVLGAVRQVEAMYREEVATGGRDESVPRPGVSGR